MFEVSDLELESWKCHGPITWEGSNSISIGNFSFKTEQMMSYPRHCNSAGWILRKKLEVCHLQGKEKCLGLALDAAKDVLILFEQVNQ